MSATFTVDFKNTVVGDASIRPQAALTASANGGHVDLENGDGQTFAEVHNGATDFASADETYVVKLQEAKEDPANLGNPLSSDWSDVSGASVSVTAANKRNTIVTDRRSKRFVRVVLTIAGTTPSILICAAIYARKKIAGSGPGNQL